MKKTKNDRISAEFYGEHKSGDLEKFKDEVLEALLDGD